MESDDFWALCGENCTDRELRVLRLRASGYQTWEIAETLGISSSAVRMRQKRCMTRIRSRKQPARSWYDPHTLRDDTTGWA